MVDLLSCKTSLTSSFPLSLYLYPRTPLTPWHKARRLCCWMGPNHSSMGTHKTNTPSC